MVSLGLSPLVRARPPNRVVIAQHAEDAAVLRNTRSILVRAPHVKLAHLGRLDERLAAHLDGLEVAGEHGAAMAGAALESPGRGQVFTATALAIETRDAAGLDRVLAAAQALPESRPGAASAFGWVSAASLRGITRALLDSPNAFRREMALAACAMHEVDPGAALAAGANDADGVLRARALRVIGEGGHLPLLPLCLAALGDEDAACAFQAARSALLLGDRGRSLASLDAIAAVPGPWQTMALSLTLKVLALPTVRERLARLARDPANVRLLLRSVGDSGDPHFVPWLVQQMRDPALARLAGEAFSTLTGLDLALLDLERKRPKAPANGPADDPASDTVTIEEDESLPWPDPERIECWWQAHGQRFAPGARYFMGKAPTLASCLEVLRTGFQRQRMAAAEYLCLIRPGTPLFNTAAPAWRQQRRLDALHA